MGKMKNTVSFASVGEDVEQLEPCRTGGGSVTNTQHTPS